MLPESLHHISPPCWEYLQNLVLQGHTTFYCVIKDLIFHRLGGKYIYKGYDSAAHQNTELQLQSFALLGTLTWDEVPLKSAGML